ncbi:hypothetical protein JCM33374_g3636 [Metschnikowia sp. JCM 33374]|nr:hypothetical protein JCM33374_g3636 [Metschnikowia sp. JCM 33374]
MGSKIPLVVVPFSTSSWTGSYQPSTVTGPGWRQDSSCCCAWCDRKPPPGSALTPPSRQFGTDGAKTPVVTVPLSTSTWTGSYTTTETVTGPDGSKTPLVVVPFFHGFLSDWVLHNH